MKRFSLFAVLAAVSLVSACAKPPGSIAPVGVSSRDFDEMDCRLLASEISRNRADLQSAEARQRGAVAADTAGVFLVLIPPTVFLGDASEDVALGKGNAIAMERSFNQRCI